MNQKFELLIVFVFFLQLIVATTTVTPTSSTLLLIVGDINFETVRILHQSLNQQNQTLLVQVFNVNSTSSNAIQVQELTINSFHTHPQILILDTLQPATKYNVRFGDEKNNDVVSFRTFATWQTKLRLAYVSCNRYFEDEDESFLKQLAEEALERDGTVHLGDQIYADILKDQFVEGKHTFDELVDQYRHVYIKTWSNPSIQQILRNGGNWMIGDDHDFANNADDEKMAGKYRILLLAAQKAFEEYQFQLMMDVNENTQDFFYSKRIGNTGIYFLDVRVHRTFYFEQKYPLFGRKQLEDFENTISNWGEDDSIKHIIVGVAIPFFINPESSAKLVDFIEQEKLTSHPKLSNDTKRALDILLPYQKKIQIIAGDAHIFLNTSLCRNHSLPCLSQITTSGITKGSAVIHSIKLTLFTLSWVYLTTNTVQNYSYYHHQVFLGENFVELFIDEDSRIVMPILKQLSLFDSAIQLWFNHFMLFVGFMIPTLIALVIQKRVTAMTSGYLDSL